ncbi:hypothetical protein AAVH_25657 [Aphelenchoides avenae]|nr:hypothetical protein AAVH_25657 [Aphelenchus avenae]
MSVAAKYSVLLLFVAIYCRALAKPDPRSVDPQRKININIGAEDNSVHGEKGGKTGVEKPQIPGRPRDTDDGGHTGGDPNPGNGGHDVRSKEVARTLAVEDKEVVEAKEVVDEDVAAEEMVSVTAVVQAVAEEEAEAVPVVEVGAMAGMEEVDMAETAEEEVDGEVLAAVTEALAESTLREASATTVPTISIGMLRGAIGQS